METKSIDDKTIVVVAVNDDEADANSVIGDTNKASEEPEELYNIPDEETTTLATESSATETTVTASTSTDRDDNNCNKDCDSGVTTSISTSSTNNDDPTESTTATTTPLSSSLSSAPPAVVVDCDRPLLTRAWSFPFPIQYEDDEALDNEGKACYHHHGWDTGEETKSNLYRQTTDTRQKYPNLRFYFLP